MLHAAGAHQARLILVCVDEQSAITRIVEHVQAGFPQARLLTRARDREHARELLQMGVTTPVRETFESAMVLGREATMALGAEPQAADDIAADVRRRDAERMDLELAGGMEAGKSRILGNLDRGVRG